MHNSREKKNFSITHRRIKTDISQSYQSRNYASLTETKSINHNVRHKTENRDFKSSNFSRMDFDSSRSYIRSPNLAHKLTYNKWFIKPQNRLKQSLLQLKPKENGSSIVIQIFNLLIINFMNKIFVRNNVHSRPIKMKS